MNTRIGVFVSVLACAAAPALAGVVTPLGPSSYLSFADSPLNGLAFDYFHLETFEDGLNTPGASASSGTIVANGEAIDSVDGDDGAIDGSGNGGTSWYPGQQAISFSFDALALGGNLPTHVGIVWTDVGLVFAGDFGVTDITVRAFDAGNNELASFIAPGLGDGSVLGGTAEDRFLGVIAPGGIARIELSTSNSTDWEVDHLQYGYVPAPGALALAGLGGLVAVRRRRG